LARRTCRAAERRTKERSKEITVMEHQHERHEKAGGHEGAASHGSSMNAAIDHCSRPPRGIESPMYRKEP